MSQLPPCPACGTNRHTKAYGSGKLFFCDRCKGQFDDDPNEGGIAYNDPVKSLEVKERREHKRQQHSFTTRKR
jgi:hypothetical protein